MKRGAHRPISKRELEAQLINGQQSTYMVAVSSKYFREIARTVAQDHFVIHSHETFGGLITSYGSQVKVRLSLIKLDK